MADPTPYDPSFDFADQQDANPAEPLPAQVLDNELANIATSIDSIIEALGDIRRSDGSLKNGIVKRESVGSGVLLKGDTGDPGPRGFSAWTPIISTAVDGTRVVLKVDWVGGGGTKPLTGYVGAGGVVTSISSAYDIRGPQGLPGQDGVIVIPASNVTLPTFSPGTAQVGVPLTGSRGTWAGTEPIAFGYQWYWADTQAPIAGATNLIYTPVTADIGHPLRFEVRGSNAANPVPAVASSVFSPPVIAAGTTSAPQFLSGASVSGVAAIGSTLAADPGVWTGAPVPVFAFQWFQSDTNTAIAGAQAQTYAPKVSDYGHPLRCRITGSNGIGQPVPIFTPATAAVAGQAPSFTAAPTLSPTSAVPGQSVTCSPGTIAGYPVPQVAYQWFNLATTADIANAVTSSYNPLTGDVGKSLKCRVTINNGIGQPVSAVTTNAAQIVSATQTSAPVVQSAPVITGGPPVVGQPLTCTDAVFSGSPTPTITRQWFWADVANAPIAGATNPTYTPVAADAGHTLKCINYGSNSVQQNVPASSVATAAVAAAPTTLIKPVLVTSPSVSGSTEEGGSLTPTQAVWIEDSSQLVAPTNTSAPSISAPSLQAGQIVTADRGAWSAIPAIEFTDAWTRDDVVISGATGLTYTLTADDLGHDIQFRTTGSNGVAPDGLASSNILTIPANSYRTIQMPVRNAATVTLGTSLPVPFEENFDGADIDNSRWVESLAWGDPNLNGALEVMCAEGNIVSDGTLKIRATKETVIESKRQTVCQYVSGIINSLDSFCFQYGYVEARFKTPAAGAGYWPALWLMPANNTWPPEIDIFEGIGDPTKSYQTLHFKDANGAHILAGKETVMASHGLTGTDEFHTYGLDWQADYIEWFIDGVSVHRVDAGDIYDGAIVTIPSTPFYLIANMEIGGGWPGPPNAQTAFPADFEIDYIKVLAAKPSAGGADTTTLWSTTDKSTYWSVSPDGLTASLASSFYDGRGIRATAGVPLASPYRHAVEYTMDRLNNPVKFHIGFLNGTLGMDSQPDAAGSGNNGASYERDGTLIADENFGSLAPLVQGDVLRMEVRAGWVSAFVNGVHQKTTLWTNPGAVDVFPFAYVEETSGGQEPIITANFSEWDTDGEEFVGCNFDPTYATANVILDRLNNRYNTGGGPTAQRAARLTNTIDAGELVYIEFQTSAVFYVSMALGIVNDAWATNVYPGDDANGISIDQTGVIYGNDGGVNVASNTNLNFTRVSLAVNRTANRAWLRNEGGDWNGNAAADPATNIGGIDISFLGSGPLHFAMWSNVDTNTEIVVYSLPNTWTLTVPSGFGPINAA